MIRVSVDDSYMRFSYNGLCVSYPVYSYAPYVWSFKDAYEDFIGRI